MMIDISYFFGKIVFLVYLLPFQHRPLDVDGREVLADVGHLFLAGVQGVHSVVIEQFFIGEGRQLGHKVYKYNCE